MFRIFFFPALMLGLTKVEDINLVVLMDRKYTLERMFTNQLLESAKDESSYRTVIRDVKTRSPLLQIILLNPSSWSCTGYCLNAEGNTGPVSNMYLHPVIKVLFSDCNNSAESQPRLVN